MTGSHWLGLVLVVLELHASTAAAAACGRIGWNAVAVLLTAPCNAAVGRARRRVQGAGWRRGQEQCACVRLVRLAQGV